MLQRKRRLWSFSAQRIKVVELFRNQASDWKADSVGFLGTYAAQYFTGASCTVRYGPSLLSMYVQTVSLDKMRLRRNKTKFVNLQN